MPREAIASARTGQINESLASVSFRMIRRMVSGLVSSTEAARMHSACSDGDGNARHKAFAATSREIFRCKLKKPAEVHAIATPCLVSPRDRHGTSAMRPRPKSRSPPSAGAAVIRRPPRQLRARSHKLSLCPRTSAQSLALAPLQRCQGEVWPGSSFAGANSPRSMGAWPGREPQSGCRRIHSRYL